MPVLPLRTCFLISAFLPSPEASAVTESPMVEFLGTMQAGLVMSGVIYTLKEQTTLKTSFGMLCWVRRLQSSLAMVIRGSFRPGQGWLDSVSFLWGFVKEMSATSA